MQLTEPHMRKVLEPFKIRDGNAARIQIHIGNNPHPVRLEDVICFGGCWAVCGFRDNLGFDSRSVLAGNLIFKCRWNEDVTFQFEDIS